MLSVLGEISDFDQFRRRARRKRAECCARRRTRSAGVVRESATCQHIALHRRNARPAAWCRLHAAKSPRCSRWRNRPISATWVAGMRTTRRQAPLKRRTRSAGVVRGSATCQHMLLHRGNPRPVTWCLACSESPRCRRWRNLTISTNFAATWVAGTCRTPPQVAHTMRGRGARLGHVPAHATAPPACSACCLA